MEGACSAASAAHLLQVALARRSACAPRRNRSIWSSACCYSPPAPPPLELLLDRDLKDIARRRLFSPPCAVWGSPSLFCTNPAGLGVALLASTRMWVGNSQRQRQQMWVMREEIKSTLPSWHWLRVNFCCQLNPNAHTRPPDFHSHWPRCKTRGSRSGRKQSF